MPAKTLLDHFKREAKVHAKEQGIKLSRAQEELARDLGFSDFHELIKVAKRDPNDKRLYL